MTEECHSSNLFGAQSSKHPSVIHPINVRWPAMTRQTSSSSLEGNASKQIGWCTISLHFRIVLGWCTSNCKFCHFYPFEPQSLLHQRNIIGARSLIQGGIKWGVGTWPVALQWVCQHEWWGSLPVGWGNQAVKCNLGLPASLFLVLCLATQFPWPVTFCLKSYFL